MVNHVRTVLLNVTAAKAPDSVYVSPVFRPVVVPQELQRLHKLLLSASTEEDEAQRLNTLMRLLHAADFEHYVLLPDARITYTAASQQDFFAAADDSSTAIDFSQLYSLVQTEVQNLDQNRQGLFLPALRYPDVMAELRDLWNGSIAVIDRLTAAILALAFRLDALR